MSGFSHTVLSCLTPQCIEGALQCLYIIQGREGGEEREGEKKEGGGGGGGHESHERMACQLAMFEGVGVMRPCSYKSPPTTGRFTLSTQGYVTRRLLA